MSRFRIVWCSSALILGVACVKSESSAEGARAIAASAGTVDSALPNEERLRRFRATIAERPDTFRRASASLDALVRRWALAVQTSDTAALNAMVLDRAEFAWLFYPTTRLAQPPYDMPPALLWEQVLVNSDDGARRVMKQYGGRTLIVRSIRCPAPADTEGVNVVRQGCLVRLRAGSDTIPEGRYFGTIVERSGRFKLLGFANEL